MKRVIASATAVVLLAGIAAAQPGRPDFSGEWEMDVDRTRAANQARRGGGATMGAGAMGASTAARTGGPPSVNAVRITQTTTTLTIERVAGQVWPKTVYRLDGAESTNVNGSSTQKLRSRWDGPRLVTEGTSETKFSDGSGSMSSTVKEVRWIDKDGTLVVETTRTITNSGPVVTSSGGKPIVSVQYFKKR
jgi:hypothetical protein